MSTNVGYPKEHPLGDAVEVIVTSNDPRNRLIVANVVTDALRQHGFGNVDTIESTTMDALPETNIPSLMDRIRQNNQKFFETPVTVWSAPDPRLLINSALDACEAGWITPPPAIQAQTRQAKQIISDRSKELRLLYQETYLERQRQADLEELVPVYPDYSSLRHNLVGLSDSSGERVPPASPIENEMTCFIATPGLVAPKHTEVVVTYPENRQAEAFDKIDEYEQRYKDLKFLVVPATGVTEERLAVANEKAAYLKGPKIPLSPQGQENVAAMKAGLERMKAEKLNAAVAGVSVKGPSSKFMKISELQPDHPMRLMVEQALTEGFVPTQVGVF